MQMLLLEVISPAHQLQPCWPSLQHEMESSRLLGFDDREKDWAWKASLLCSTEDLNPEHFMNFYLFLTTWKHLEASLQSPYSLHHKLVYLASHYKANKYIKLPTIVHLCDRA